MPVIEARGLTKIFRRPIKGDGFGGAVKHLFTRRYTDHVAVDHIDLTVDAGEAVAYVGPNGAGKSTTVKLLSGILVPTSGEVRVGGAVPHVDRIANAHRIGVLFGQRTQLWWDLPVRDSLTLLRDMYSISPSAYARRIAELDEVLELGELLPVVARKLSLGQRMRADLAAALLHSPQVVYLDEPTIGLDISVKDRVRAFLRQLRAQGTTIILTTHDLGDIEDVCQRIVIIDEGKIIFDGGLAAVKDGFARQRRLHVLLAQPASLAVVAALLPACDVSTTSPVSAPGSAAAPSAAAPSVAAESSTEFTIPFDRFSLTAGQIITALLPLGEIVDIRIDEPAIEDVIRKVYAGELDLAASVEADRQPEGAALVETA